MCCWLSDFYCATVKAQVHNVHARTHPHTHIYSHSHTGAKCGSVKASKCPKVPLHCKCVEGFWYLWWAANRRSPQETEEIIPPCHDCRYIRGVQTSIKPLVGWSPSLDALGPIMLCAEELAKVGILIESFFWSLSKLTFGRRARWTISELFWHEELSRPSSTVSLLLQSQQHWRSSPSRDNLFLESDTDWKMNPLYASVFPNQSSVLNTRMAWQTRNPSLY